MRRGNNFFLILLTLVAEIEIKGLLVLRERERKNSCDVTILNNHVLIYPFERESKKEILMVNNHIKPIKIIIKNRSRQRR